MKRLAVALAFVSLALVACVDTTGLTGDLKSPPKGNPNSLVVVQEYADLQCPACGAAYPQIVKPLLEKYGSRVRFEFHHFPLRSLHRYALDAAEAAECAADQWKFWEFIDRDFTEQSKLNKEQLTEWGKELNLDMDLFDRCRRSHIKKDAILASYDEGVAKGVQGTPTFFVNGKQVPSTLDDLSKAIDDALAATMRRL
jgi:protein-disulfide isomerase